MELLGVSTGVLVVLILYTVFFFFITLYRPTFGVMAIIPIIGLGFEQSSIIKGGFVALIAIAVFLNTLVTSRKFPLSQDVVLAILTFLLMIVWVLLRAFLTGEDLSFWFFWVVKRLFVPGFSAFLIIFLFRTEKDIMRFIYALVAFTGITAMFGLLQYFSASDFFWQAREILGVPLSIAYQIEGRIRITGLASYVIPFTYQLASIFPLAGVLLFLERNRPFTKKLIFFILVLIIFLALVLTFVKSGIGGGVIGSFFVVLLIFYANIIDKRKMFALVLMAVLCFSGLFLVPSLKQKIINFGDTSRERISIILTAVKVSVENPLGVGALYSQSAEDVYSDTDVSDLPGSRVVLVHFPHNIIFNILAILGLPALAIAFLFYFFIIRSLFRVYKSADKFFRTLSAGLLGGFVAYLLNALFHNNSPFFGDAFSWLFIGISMAIINFYFLNKQTITQVADK